MLQQDNFKLNTNRHYNKEGLILNDLWEVTFFTAEGLKSSIRLRRLEEENTYELNHNVEAPDLVKHKENIRLITENFDGNIQHHSNMMDQFLKVVINE